MSQKKIHRFFIASLPHSETFVLTDTALIHQIRSVLHLTIGESIILFGNTDEEYVMRIESLEKESISLLLESVRQVSQPKRTVIAAVSIVKKDLFEVIVQKLTEIGVSEIVPIISSRTIKQSVRMDRLQAISMEALEQCGGTKEVRIHEPKMLSECLKEFPQYSIVFSQDGAALTDNMPDTVIMYIGPEGGWSNEDMTRFTDHGVSLITLGSRTLRAETAAIVGAYNILCI